MNAEIREDTSILLVESRTNMWIGKGTAVEDLKLSSFLSQNLTQNTMMQVKSPKGIGWIYAPLIQIKGCETLEETRFLSELLELVLAENNLTFLLASDDLHQRTFLFGNEEYRDLSRSEILRRGMLLDIVMDVALEQGKPYRTITEIRKGDYATAKHYGDGRNSVGFISKSISAALNVY